jgi:hypothetical protein
MSCCSLLVLTPLKADEVANFSGEW